jgi:hypothetical protein
MQKVERIGEALFHPHLHPHDGSALAFTADQCKVVKTYVYNIPFGAQEPPL